MLDWQHGQPFSSQFSDIYFSRDTGLEEKRYTFLQGNRLAERFASLSSGDGFAIGETGFGTGLSFLCAWQLFDKTAPLTSNLDFFSVEKYPLEEQELTDALALWPELRHYASNLIARWRRRVPGWNRWVLDGGRVRLTLVIGDVAEALPEIRGGIDAWFLDGFSPARNPEMWTQQVLEHIANASRPGATCATYTSAGPVRRGLAQAGFQVYKSRGFGRKREMLRGCLPASHTSARTPGPVPTTAIVIGGGISGCAAAWALAMRGISVTLVEGASVLASAASGNPLGILHARLSAGMNPLQHFVLASYGHALGLLDEKLPVDGIARAECGELQLAFSADETKRIDKLFALGWPPHVMRRVDAAEASSLAGIELPYGGLLFPAAGWLVPPRLCAALADNPAIQQLTGHRVRSLTAVNNGWLVKMENSHKRCSSYEVQIVAVCIGYQVKSLPPLTNLPLTPVRGQITALPATLHSNRLRAILCGGGYITPAVAGMHMAGATHDFNDEGVDLRARDHAENLSRLAEISPALAGALYFDALDVGQLSGRASVRGSVPGAMPLVGELLPGLYTSLGHGTRGLITAGLSGELIAAAACGQLLPLPWAIVKALTPAKWLQSKDVCKHTG
ncbi:bifunctional tRNA (5-methylaminomethyl-2-thiouridine)(34)-methyltransferase MnmD/FAD-dependent 5-carboxymethylaminomethyl-2-thiouridine(34) oxidoreductase MnmC [Nitrosovibrio tenuis]|uniref:tRNA 5-methylaminomethyl-2-thiouridine biosynthesis bifunctional protein MnmC n=1 Tax=Nitrosovibrio tenuis TaxID=1233 RepID=A0A1H7MRB7_9PROT|nr:bifunctional tRNA (5-methylaminomethyl-2-thiouridine)(34)-methyltransferase MnmD/FAD-dependent 5-carboxymethylaminomethyl-2-thiouridine(34) oxidoreductase MnmC [Nitrosovibrio tenuis]SEL13830.1 tRNA 5-methylaminomethyl-2-thiouridine biosynthesis bifunctional protein [Nitrosovibrio tenuis]